MSESVIYGAGYHGRPKGTGTFRGLVTCLSPLVPGAAVGAGRVLWRLTRRGQMDPSGRDHVHGPDTAARGGLGNGHPRASGITTDDDS